MNQALSPVCNEITDFDFFCGLMVRAVRKQDTNITLFAEESARRNLHEVWLLPESADAFTPSILTRMCVNSIEELVRLFDPGSDVRACTAYKKQQDLLHAFAPQLDRAHFLYGSYETVSGPVVRIVFGDSWSMKDFESAGFDLESTD